MPRFCFTAVLQQTLGESLKLWASPFLWNCCTSAAPIFAKHLGSVNKIHDKTTTVLLKTCIGFRGQEAYLWHHYSTWYYSAGVWCDEKVMKVILSKHCRRGRLTMDLGKFWMSLFSESCIPAQCTESASRCGRNLCQTSRMKSYSVLILFKWVFYHHWHYFMSGNNYPWKKSTAETMTSALGTPQLLRVPSCPKGRCSSTTQ